jgi:hypothetical protein
MKLTIDRLLFLFILMVFAGVPGTSRAVGYFGVTNPLGMSDIGTFPYRTPDGLYPSYITYSTSKIYSVDFKTHTWTRIFDAPPGRAIVHAQQKQSGQSVLVLMDNGDVWGSKDQNGPFILLSEIGRITTESFATILGDALYALTTSYAYVSRDSGLTWHVDSVGLNAGTVAGLCMDSLQNVYAATRYGNSDGLYRQSPDTSIWHKVSSFPTIACYSVFVDSRNRIYVGTNGQGIYVSTNAGSTFNPDSAGMGSVQIAKFAEDSAGDVYALGYGTALYRSAGGTQPWVRIDSGLVAFTGPNVRINDLSTIDSLLLVATNFGLCYSVRQTNVWQFVPDTIQSKNITGFARTPAGRFVVGAERGIFYRNAGDSIWTKTYPPQGYLGNLSLESDGLGNIYTRDFSYSNNKPLIFKSGDGGLTWVVDTTGFGALPFNYFSFFIDEGGGQHCSSTPSGSNEIPWRRDYGGSWQADTLGMDLSGSNLYARGFAGDGSGNLYVSYSDGKIYRRTLTGPSWVVDTSGLVAGALGPMWSGVSGDVYGKSSSGLYRRHNGVWAKMMLPIGVADNSFVQGLSVDGNSTLWASFVDNYSNLGKGVSFTTTGGASWTHVGLDSVRLNQLVSYGDTTYALTQASGSFKMTAAIQTGVDDPAAVPRSFALMQNYPNPFNPSTTIEYSLERRAQVTLNIYDVLGQSVKRLVDESKSAGEYRVVWDGRNESGKSVASGVYFYRLEVNNHVDSKKMILLK